uniref:Transmembrane protein n=1 Tax=Chromera velia CCMP2878 TaxID=1169474 RepID=A0A0G4HLR0_9ALVE|eukprot:Cvel_28857.t1-p1 / transcript=Cvel_28857.t1 / gene=Cvel_28857 / organism=Chromera_velia_CCMP2878 / gene_product=S-antigen protein, putative / transcript_product=S-antigen protein, putative / location=Cvel_scaffold3852:11022-12824(+) / protein_length=459 / sequence_SO=supercontig / SO=protein_coding / is_pseudo=false
MPGSSTTYGGCGVSEPLVKKLFWAISAEEFLGPPSNFPDTSLPVVWEGRIRNPKQEQCLYVIEKPTSAGSSASTFCSSGRGGCAVQSPPNCLHTPASPGAEAGAGEEDTVPTEGELAVAQGEEDTVPTEGELAVAQGEEDTVPTEGELAVAQGEEDTVPTEGELAVAQGEEDTVPTEGELAVAQGEEDTVPTEGELAVTQGEKEAETLFESLLIEGRRRDAIVLTLSGAGFLAGAKGLISIGAPAFPLFVILLSLCLLALVGVSRVSSRGNKRPPFERDLERGVGARQEWFEKGVAELKDIQALERRMWSLTVCIFVYALIPVFLYLVFALSYAISAPTPIRGKFGDSFRDDLRLRLRSVYLEPPFELPQPVIETERRYLRRRVPQVEPEAAETDMQRDVLSLSSFPLYRSVILVSLWVVVGALWLLTRLLKRQRRGKPLERFGASALPSCCPPPLSGD